MFKNRKEAGQKLGEALKKYKGHDVVVLAIPRGGVIVGCEVVILETPHNFMAVAEVYEDWYDVPDVEVIEIMRLWAKTHRLP